MKPVRRNHEEASAQVLLDVLDEAVALQEGALEELADLADAVRARDDDAVENLLVRLGRTRASLDDAERRCDAERLRLGARLGLGAEAATLGRIADALGGPDARALEERRTRIREVTEAVRRRHLRTAVLLAQVARVNRELLQGLFSRSGTTRTYRTDGTAPWHPERGLVDARR